MAISQKLQLDHCSFLSFCSSAGHIIGLTAPPANKNINIVPPGLGRLHERMYVRFCFIYLCFSPLLLSFPLLGTRSSYVLVLTLRGTWKMLT